MTPAALAVDAGQTEIRAALTGGRGPRTTTAAGVERLGRGVDADGLAAGLLAALTALGPLPAPPPPVGIGLSGFEAAAEADLERMHHLLHERLGVERVAIGSDGLTSLLGALGDRPGVVVAAGTGTVAVGRSGDRWARVDGWGSLLGDAGSGFAIGRAGLDAALRRVDGRGGSAVLLRAAAERFGSVEELPGAVYGAPVPTRAVASFAADVARAAAKGDAAAKRIVGEAATELARTACAALDRLFEPGERVALSYTGSLFGSEEIRRRFLAAVARQRPAAEPVPPAGDSLAGAALLAQRELRPEPGILWRVA